jgi:hypothetical protein
MAKASLFWDTSIQAYRLKLVGDYARVERMVDFLKKNIPSSDRELIVKEDPLTHRKDYTWTFTEKYFDGTLKLLHLIYGAAEVAVVTKAQVEAAQQPRLNLTSGGNSLHTACYEFLKSIPYESAQKAYRDAAMRLHPDKGGDMQQMSIVNSLWTKLQKEIYGQ